MLKGLGLIYIRHERNTGVSKKTEQAYDFANIQLSDGLESFKLDIKPELTEAPVLQNLKKGDKVNITVDVFESFNRTAFIVSEVMKA